VGICKPTLKAQYVARRLPLSFERGAGVCSRVAECLKNVLSVHLVFLCLLLWPDDAAESARPGELPGVTIKCHDPLAKCGRYPSGYV
jgi:hypothetical protein